MRVETAAWPELHLVEWADTCATLHMWTQVIGKVKLAVTPMTNHWWNVALYLTSRGLTTSPMPHGGRTFEMAFDFVDHRLDIEVSDGTRRSLALEPRSVAEFYRDVMAALAAVGIEVRVWPMPVEIPSPIRFDRDTEHAAYDRDAVARWWQALSAIDAVLKEFRARFLGKCSPVHFFWGSFDLAVTRFNGRRAPARDNADVITREAYSHEVISAGFWPGSGVVPDAAFYAYAAPEPPGFKAARVNPAAASYNDGFGEFILMYDDVRQTPSPRAMLLEFLQSTYAAAADLAAWNRAELER